MIVPPTERIELRTDQSPFVTRKEVSAETGFGRKPTIDLMNKIGSVWIRDRQFVRRVDFERYLGRPTGLAPAVVPPKSRVAGRR